MHDESSVGWAAATATEAELEDTADEVTWAAEDEDEVVAAATAVVEEEATAEVAAAVPSVAVTVCSVPPSINAGPGMT